MSVLTDKHPTDPAPDWVDDSISDRALKCAMYLDLLGLITTEEHKAILGKLTFYVQNV